MSDIPSAGTNNGGSMLTIEICEAAYSWGKKGLSLASFAAAMSLSEVTTRNWNRYGREISDLIGAGSHTIDDFSDFRQLCYKFHTEYERGKADRAEGLVEALDSIEKPSARWTLHQLAQLDENYKEEKTKHVSINVVDRGDIIHALRAILEGGGDVIEGKATPALDTDSPKLLD